MKFYSCALTVSGVLLIGHPSLAIEKAPNSPATVRIEIRVSPTNPPMFFGTTNLPDGLLPYSLRGDKPGCSIQCGFSGAADIRNGKFSFTVSMPNTGAAIESDSYTFDIITVDNSKKLKIPFGDPADPFNSIRFTARVIVSQATSHLFEESARFLPLKMDEKYIQDEIAHGHSVP
jgi:hypothetical protein